MNASGPRIVFVIPEDWYFWTHRLPLARAMRDAGFDVVIATRVHEHAHRITAEGLRVAPIRLRRAGRNPLREIGSILDLVKLYRRERPVMVHHVTIKPVLYGSVAARIAHVPAVVNAVAGLGHVFAGVGWRARLMQGAFRLGFTTALAVQKSIVIFQTEADQRELVSRGVVSAERTVVIRGAGVNTKEFIQHPEPDGPPIVMFAGRLLWSKGVGELIKAGQILNQPERRCRIVLVGKPDGDNPMAIAAAQLEEWVRDGSAEWWGSSEDMPSTLRQAAIVVLPSYYGEGVPKILLEAASSGRAIVASDLPGCRDVVRNGENGLIVPPRNPVLLAEVIARLISDRDLRTRLGTRGRAIVLEAFAEDAIVDATIATYRGVLAETQRGASALALL